MAAVRQLGSRNAVAFAGGADDVHIIMDPLIADRRGSISDGAEGEGTIFQNTGIGRLRVVRDIDAESIDEDKIHGEGRVRTASAALMHFDG